MLVKYYNNPELAYANRRRYTSFPFVPFAQEEQRSILLGDGAYTSIKTSKSNICNYVQIDDTRWYVTHYIYMNGGQVTLFLQRDVVGEFGLGKAFGKIERGYTESILRNRKELRLNQILKSRKKLIPQNGVYGNYSVDNHKNELWGILYIVKPTEIDPITGNDNPKYVSRFNINIPGFIPKVTEYDFIADGTRKLIAGSTDVKVEFAVKFTQSVSTHKVIIVFSRNGSSWDYNITSSEISNFFPSDTERMSATFNVSLSAVFPSQFYKNYAEKIGVLIANNLISNYSSEKGFSFPSMPSSYAQYVDYNDIIVKVDDKYYSYSTNYSDTDRYGTTTSDKSLFYENFIKSAIEGKTIESNGTTSVNVKSIDLVSNSFANLSYTSKGTVTAITYNCVEITADDAGVFTIDVSQSLIDEPYIIMACPLFNVKIEGNGETYEISKEKAFMVFNTIIQYLSGENAYIVDAQVYPYCPVLNKVSSKILGIPFFTIANTSYNHIVNVQLLPSSDVKKEYIEREYSIISPEQTSKVNFNFYDYINTIEDVDGKNYKDLTIVIKTALKPFAIIASAVIQPEYGSLMNITYDSDLRGSQPSSNGFECSLATNQFEQYKRQNSNYQQIFELDKEELKKQHEVELANDIVSTVVNTASATAMGAIAGTAMGDAGIGNLFGSKAAGAAIGATATGATVGAAMAVQTGLNNDLRKYEERLQQQRFDLNIGTIQNLPNSVNRISSFNEIIIKDFWFIIETYECSDYEKTVADNFIQNYGYAIGVYDFIANYQKDGWFIRASVISSEYPMNLHEILVKEIGGGIYIYEQG